MATSASRAPASEHFDKMEGFMFDSGSELSTQNLVKEDGLFGTAVTYFNIKLQLRYFEGF